MQAGAARGRRLGASRARRAPTTRLSGHARRCSTSSSSQPEIPPNTGNVIRLAANTGCALHLVEPLGFSMDDKLLRRAGLDYHEYADVRRHASWAALRRDAQRRRRPPASPSRRAAARRFAEVAWQPGDWLVFGCETAGLPAALRDGVRRQRSACACRCGRASAA